jgi:hypothetical protein
VKFYEAAAQIIPTLLVALAIEAQIVTFVRAMQVGFIVVGIAIFVSEGVALMVLSGEWRPTETWELLIRDTIALTVGIAASPLLFTWRRRPDKPREDESDDDPDDDDDDDPDD